MNQAFLALGGVGFLVGFRHAFEPDHLAAVVTLASRDDWRSASRLGVAWGVGHTASVGLVALLIAALGVRVPDAFFRLAELGVAALLIALGASALLSEARRHRAAGGTAHQRAHHNAHTHAHPHSHGGVRNARSALWFGIAHGLAGSGAVMVLIVAAARTVGQQVAYLIVFGIGTIAGMSAVSLLGGALTGAASARSRHLAVTVRVGAAAASVVAGTWLGASILAT